MYLSLGIMKPLSHLWFNSQSKKEYTKPEPHPLIYSSISTQCCDTGRIKILYNEKVNSHNSTLKLPSFCNKSTYDALVWLPRTGLGKSHWLSCHCPESVTGIAQNVNLTECSDLMTGDDALSQLHKGTYLDDSFPHQHGYQASIRISAQGRWGGSVG